MACSPATPAPITRTLAGGTVPAAVMNIGKNLARCSAADQAGPVAGHRGLGGQGVHRLRPADPGEQVEAVDGGSLVGQGLDRLGCGHRLQEADDARRPSGRAATSSRDGGWTRATIEAPAEGGGGVGARRWRRPRRTPHPRSGPQSPAPASTPRRPRTRPAWPPLRGRWPHGLRPGRDSLTTASFTARGIQANRRRPTTPFPICGPIRPADGRRILPVRTAISVRHPLVPRSDRSGGVVRATRANPR